MKTIVVIVALCAAVVSVAGLTVKLEKQLEKCLEEAKLTKGVVRELCKNGVPFPEQIFGFKFLVSCVLYAAEIVKRTSDRSRLVDVIPTNIGNLVPKANVPEAMRIVEKCKTEASDDWTTMAVSVFIMNKLAQSNLKEIVCDSLVDITDA